MPQICSSPQKRWKSIRSSARECLMYSFTMEDCVWRTCPAKCVAHCLNCCISPCVYHDEFSSCRVLGGVITRVDVSENRTRLNLRKGSACLVDFIVAGVEMTLCGKYVMVHEAKMLNKHQQMSLNNLVPGPFTLLDRRTLRRGL